jgi:ribosomal protein S3
MGQKVHPLGFRVGITKNHQSQWFARFQKYGYSQSVFEDHMLRKTLLNLFSNFEKENALADQLRSKKGNKAGANTSKTPKITQIKIERGLIPYEIGIQIHSDDCLAITKAIDNIKISKDLVSNLQKTRKYLFKAATQLKTTQTDLVQTLGTSDTSSDSTTKHKQDQQRATQSKKRKFKIRNNKKVKGKSFFKPRRKQKKRLPKPLFMRLKNLKRRFKKRQNIKKRYLNIISKGLLIRKKGNLIIRSVKIKRKNKKGDYATSRLSKAKQKNTLTRNKNKQQLLQKTARIRRFSNRMYKKFANLFLTKLNKQFLVRLKSIMKYWYNQKLTKAPLGYNKKWYSAKSYALINNLKAKYLSKDLKGLGVYQVEKLTKLISILEKKSLVKMETLRKDFITFGTLSKTRAFGYYQIITFLKQLKELVTKIKKQTLVTVNGNIKRLSAETTIASGSNKEKIQNLIRAKSKQKKAITQKVLNNIVNLVDNNQAMINECRKIKWISYLKDIVNKHRTENIFYYLATIADARKDLKALKRYTKQHSNFLFGINLENAPNALLQRITKTLTQSSKNSLTDKESSEGLTLQKAFLAQIENQRKMYKANLALTPKISIKFFSVKTTDVLEKASSVGDSIVDALEKRKAFRGVIKKAKEDLMRRPRVKGVKIQVSGRLNGAEIARSEWVRAGRVPLQTLRANIDYSYRTASTIYGIIGVKVWIFKGYSKI